MKAKTKIVTSGSIPHFSYTKVSLPWGLGASYKGYDLNFYQNLKVHNSLFQNIAKLFGTYKAKDRPEVNKKIDLYSLLSHNAKQAWVEAYKICAKRGGKELAVEDIFLALLKAESVRILLKRMNVHTKEAERLIKNYLKLTPPLCGEVVQKIPFEAFAFSVKIHNHKIGSLMLLGALLKATPHENILQAVFANIGLTAAKLELMSVWILDLPYQFPKESTSEKLLYCLNQAGSLEEHFGYFYYLNAVEKAADIARGQTLKDLEHKKALQLLVKAAGVARAKGKKTISANIVGE